MPITRRTAFAVAGGAAIATMPAFARIRQPRDPSVDHVFIAAGQSNMKGRCEGAYSCAYDDPASQIYQAGQGGLRNVDDSKTV